MTLVQVQACVGTPRPGNKRVQTGEVSPYLPASYRGVDIEILHFLTASPSLSQLCEILDLSSRYEGEEPRVLISPAECVLLTSSFRPEIHDWWR